MLNRRQLFRAAAGAAASTMITRIPNVFAAAPAKYDVIVKGGRVIDPAAKLNAIRDVAIAGGRIAAVSDEQILEAQSWLAANEGVFCEPASAAAIAGALEHGFEGERLVCVVTGHGLKDPDIAIEGAPAVVACDPRLADVERAVLG